MINHLEKIRDNFSKATDTERRLIKGVESGRDFVRICKILGLKPASPFKLSTQNHKRYRDYEKTSLQDISEARVLQDSIYKSGPSI